MSSPAVIRPLANVNTGKNYSEQIKPFNFLLSCHVAQLGHPVGADLARFHLIGPYGINARKWLETKWIDQYSRKTYWITTTGHASRNTARKIEDDNFDQCTGRQRQLYCFAISAKRYALFLLDENDLPVLLRKGKNNKENRWSEHGLGHLLNPIDPNNDDREWIADVWLKIIREQLRIRVPDSTV